MKHLLRPARLIPTSFASQLLVLFTIALLVPVGFIAALIGSDIEGAETAAGRLTVRQANQAAAEIELAYGRDTELAAILSALPEFWNGSDEDRDRILTAFSNPYPSLSGMLYFTDDFEQHGKANYVPGSERQSLSIRTYAQEAVATGQPAFADEVVAGRTSGRRILSLIIPLREQEPGARHGFISAAFLADQLPVLWDLQPLPAASAVMLVDTRSGKVIGESLNSPFTTNAVMDESLLQMVRSDATSLRV